MDDEDGRSDVVHDDKERLHSQMDFQPLHPPSRHFVGLPTPLWRRSSAGLR